MSSAQENSGSQALQTAVNVANTVRSAVKVGKAVAGIAKGAAAGGPYGAIAMAVWQNRGLILKILAAVALLILIPIIFIMSLPGLLISSIGSLFTSSALADDAIIMTNLQSSEAAITSFLDVSYQQTRTEISDEMLLLPADTIVVINAPCEHGHRVNTALIISQYYASKSDYTAVDLTDFSAVMNNSAVRFYTYTTATTTETDADSSITTTTVTYTVSYRGDHIFADEVFHLTEYQRRLANELTQNMALFLFGAGSSGGTANVTADVLRYEAAIASSAQTYGIPGFTEVIKAMMMQESGGRGTDLMQSSECAYNTLYPKSPGAITDPAYSIDAGVHYFADCLALAGCTSPSDRNKLSLALQGYNFGSGYITWALRTYGGYTATNAKEFSNIQKAKLGWKRYGDTEYVSHVLRYYPAPAVGGMAGWGSPFVGRDWRTAVTSESGYRTNPISYKTEYHDGLDIAYPTGTPINAVQNGTVTYAGENGNGFGKHIVVDCGNGLTVLYAHCNELLVTSGQTITVGAVIAKVGSTGYTTGPHLHLTIKENGNIMNPRNYIP